MVDATLQVTFAGAPEAGRPTISIELDDTKNENSGPFIAGGDPVYIRILRFPENAYQVFNTNGTISKVQERVPLDIENEIISFPNTDNGTLRYRADQVVSWSWLGIDPGKTPAFDGNIITLTEEVIGVLSVTYKVLFDRWELSNPDTVPVLIVTTMQEPEEPEEGEPVVIVDANLLVEFEEEEVVEPKDYDLLVANYCTDEEEESATVWLDGVEIGQTDQDGRINLGLLAPGSTHTLKITKTGFLDSDVDEIRNDTFTVPN